MTEMWASIEGYEGLYEVSSCGQVRSLDREIVDRAGQQRVLKGKILNPGLAHNAYPAVNLCRDGKYKRRRVHDLVLAAFIGPRPEGHQCHHRDGDKTNNRLDNLEWVTASRNIRHAYDNGLMGRACVDPEDADEIRHAYELGQSQKEIADRFGLSSSVVHQIVHGKSWFW